MTTRNRRTRTVLALAVILGVLAAFSGSLQARLLVYEPFDYPGGTYIDGLQTNAVGLAGQWRASDAAKIKGNSLAWGDLPVEANRWGPDAVWTQPWIEADLDMNKFEGRFDNGDTLWMSFVGHCLTSSFSAKWGNGNALRLGADADNYIAIDAYKSDDRDWSVFELEVTAQIVVDGVVTSSPMHILEAPHIGPGERDYSKEYDRIFFVARMIFGSTDIVEIYLPGEDRLLPESPVATVSGSIDQSTFDQLRSHVHNGNSGVDADEIRIGTMYEDVVGVVVTRAHNPNPADGAGDVARTPTLTWTPGEFSAPTNGHKVYFGESFNDVNDVTGGVAQTANSYTPTQRLDLGTTYYWRIDEVNAPPTSHIEFKGEVWSFTTEPVGYPIDGNNITATASSSDAGQGPENTVNRSGLDAKDLHSTEMTDMWLSNAADANAAWIQYEFDKVYKLHQMWVWNHNTPFEVWTGFGFKDVTIHYSTNGTEWAVLAGVTEFARGTGSPDYTHNTPVDFGGVVAKYVKITANSNWSAGATTQYGLSEVRFFYIPVWAREPKPASGATDVALDAVLAWRPGREAAEHNVYLSSKRMAVLNGTVPAITVTEASYDAGTLDLGETYYWKIDEVNMAETPTTWEGEVWSFATPECVVVEDFEDYNDYPPDRIFEMWKGGYGYTGYCGNGTGSAVGHATEPYAEQTIVHGGSQSMPFYYDNSATGTNSCDQPINLYYSETERTFDTPQDWTKAGVKELTLYFYGDPNNTAGATERIYVKVNGAKVVYDGDMADIKQESWHEWNIDLSSFGGVNLQNVTKVSIGLGNGTGPGGSGVLYFDDIRLCPSKCVLSRRSADFARVDYVADCVVDCKELEVMAENWLAVLPIVGPIPIDNPGFEDPVLGEDEYTWGDVPGWTLVGGEATGTEGSGVWNTTSADFDPVLAPEGENVLFTEYLPEGIAKGVAQVLTETFAANTDYTLTVEVGNSNYYYFSGYSVQLLAGGVVIAEDNDTLWPEYYKWATSTVHYTYDSADSALLGQPLEIRLLTLALEKDNPPAGEVVGVEFDNVTLFRSSEWINLHEDNKIDFKDYAVLADHWLHEQLWP